MSNNDVHIVVQFGFWNVGSRNELDLRNIMLLDNQYTVYLFCNKRLVKIFCTIDESMTVKGNGVTINTAYKAYVKGYGKVWLDERVITNILALNNVKSKFRVTYDSNSYEVFAVHNPSEQDVHFNMHNYGIQYHYTKNSHITPVQTVSYNKAGYRERQPNSAKLAKEIYAKVRHTSQKYFKNLIKSNIIRKFPVTSVWP